MADQPPTRAAIYARVARSNILALSRQVATCQQYADERGYQVIDTYADNGVAGWSTTIRPALRDLLANIGQYGVIVVWDADRLARSSRDVEAIIDVADHHGARIETVGGLDLSTDSGLTVLRMLSTIDKEADR